VGAVQVDPGGDAGVVVLGRGGGGAAVGVTEDADAGQVEVRDDGVGGADPAGGTGLAGLADRVDAQGGTLTLASPAGGPTILRLELPCTG
jgi:signal transduction histidine kinase